MKIALFHNSYQVRGGEDTMFELEAKALQESGNEVICYHIENSKILSNASLCDKVKTALSAPRSRHSRKSIKDFLSKHRPDISHVHNWFPIISPSIYEAHAELEIPVVQTLHNYRLGCASANYRRNGEDCTSCDQQSNLAAIRHQCYKDSLLGTITWKRVMDKGWRDGTFTNLVDRYLCPSKVVYERHKNMGIPEDRLQLLSNACQDPQKFQDNENANSGRFEVCFAGRLVHEKGASTLVQAWLEMPKSIRSKARLTVIGDGPEMPELLALAKGENDIDFIGELTHAKTLAEFNQSKLLVCPTLWAEPFGLTVIEGMGAGIPVIASNIGGPAELIKNGETGLLVRPGDVTALSEAIASCIMAPEHTERMGRQARKTFEDRYTPQAHAHALLQVFEEISRKRFHD